MTVKHKNFDFFFFAYNSAILFVMIHCNYYHGIFQIYFELTWHSLIIEYPKKCISLFFTFYMKKKLVSQDIVSR